MQESLFPLQACEGCVLAYTARRFNVKTVQFTLDSAHLDSNQKVEQVALSSELLEILTS
jgi:hypothetical protein